VHNLGRLIGTVLVGALTAAVLIFTVKFQVFDTNFYSLWEATALLAGDHPYRDFFEWGIPLQALLSAAVQRVFGYRMLGEFVTQWVFVVAGAMLAKTGPLTVSFLLNDQVLDRVRYDHDGVQHFEKAVPAGWVTVGEDVTVGASVDKPWIPPEGGPQLGIILLRIGLTQ